MKVPDDNKPLLTRTLDELPPLISDGLKRLLETKHLYQNLEIDIDKTSTMVDISNEIKSPSYGGDVSIARKCYEIAHSNWELLSNPSALSYSLVLAIHLPTIKIYCQNCNRIEPFNPYYSFEPHNGENDGNQLFIIEYQCQSCKKEPTIFMVTRKGYKLSITGRSPFEYVDVSAVIPKSSKKYFSDAIVAHNAGQTLAGLFLLRTFIEQYTRSLSSNSKQNVDQIIAEYMENLPNDFKSRFPSLANIYSNLSAAIHEANASNELFDNSSKELIEHFEAKRLYKIVDQKQ